MHWCSLVLLSLLSAPFSSNASLNGWTFSKVGAGGTSDTITVQGVGAGAFHPSRIANFVPESRAPLISPKQAGSCPPNIYNANPVNNGGAVNIFFGGWDGVSSCHDSISVAVTVDDFESFGEHVPVVATGDRMHVNNPSAVRRPDGTWAMLYTQLPKAPAEQLNKPGMSLSSDGVEFSPSAGGSEQLIQVQGYPGWDNADVNGGNVLWFSPPMGEAGGGGTYDMFFVDFHANNHSVYHATANGTAAGAPVFTYQGVALEQPGLIPNDLKRVNGYWVLGLHSNSQETHVSISGTDDHGPPSSWPTATTLFRHSGAADNYIVSCGLVVDSTSKVLKGAVYGAGAVPTLDHNSIFARWLQRRVIFRSNDNSTTWGLGASVRSHGPDAALLSTSAPSLSGRWYLYDADYVDETNPGTLLSVSQEVDVASAEVWRVAQAEANST